MLKYFLIIMIYIHVQSQEIDSLYNLAKTHQNNLEDPKALSLYLKIIKTAPTEIKAYVETSKLLCQVGFNLEDEESKIQYYKKAINHAKKAIKLDSTDAKSHLAMSRSIGRLAEISGAKQKLKLSVDVKKYAENVTRLDPGNDIAFHILGKWHYKISDLSWVEKAVANTVLGGVPEGASFENAKKAFEKAVSLNPASVSHNLELGRTLIELDREEEAREILKKVLTLKSTQSIDKKYKTDAKELLEDLD